MWAFKQLWDKGWIYEDYRVVPYSWAVESPLSNFETRLDDSYRERQDPAITVAFSLTPEPGDPMPMQLLAWTTTPWTLPSNLALAVGPEIDYVMYEENGALYILAETTVEKYDKQLEQAERYGSVKGRDLLGRRYEPLFPFFKESAQRLSRPVRGFRQYGRGHGRGAHGPRLWRRRFEHLPRQWHRGGDAGGQRRALYR